ncbi:MAG: B12-binding domain-containing radical SAM protein [Candidatus Methanoperedenaceae archaeon]|nr:MAG: B12-binding domain-containing radical SAM protein [Candidatus Methanoperedenaceae archaeon]
MKLLLINPAFFNKDEFEKRYTTFNDWIKGGNLYPLAFEPPLGIASIAAYLKSKGFDAELLDMQALLMDEHELANKLLEIRPDVVGITAMTTTFPSALRASKITRKALPDAKVVLGGVHPTIEPGTTLESRYVDFVVRGEGEVVMEQLMTELEKGGNISQIEGLSYKHNGEVILKSKSPLVDINSLPMPDYGSFPVNEYIKHNQSLRDIRCISVLATRGCPYPCSFCAVKETMGVRWRAKSPEKVVDELEYLKNKYDLEGFWFKDSILNMNRKWTSQFCEEIIKRKLDIIWQCNTRVDLIREEELKLMVKAGLTELDLGIETGSPDSLKTLKKKVTIQQTKEAVRLAKKYVKVFGFFMIGIPGETIDDVKMTFELAKELELDRSTWSIFQPLPGSELYESSLKEGTIKKEDWRCDNIHFTKCRYNLSRIPDEEIEGIYQEINDYFYKGREVSF